MRLARESLSTPLSPERLDFCSNVPQCWCNGSMLFCCMTLCRLLTARIDNRTHLFMVALCNWADHYIFVLWFLSSFFFLMAALWNRAGHYIFALWFLSFFTSFFFPRLISAVAGWMSTKFGHVVFEICERTDRLTDQQTHIRTRWSQYFALLSETK